MLQFDSQEVLQWPVGIDTGGAVTPSVRARVLATGKATERKSAAGRPLKNALSGQWGRERQGGQYGGGEMGGGQ